MYGHSRRKQNKIVSTNKRENVLKYGTIVNRIILPLARRPSEIEKEFFLGNHLADLHVARRKRK